MFASIIPDTAPCISPCHDVCTALNDKFPLANAIIPFHSSVRTVTGVSVTLSKTTHSSEIKLYVSWHNLKKVFFDN